MAAGPGATAGIELAAEPDSIGLLWDWLEARVAPLDPGPEALNAVRLSAEEIATNIVLHAFPDRPGGMFRVRLEREGRLRLTFEDEGIPFDPTGHAGPPAPGSIAEASIGGLGIPLVRGFVAAMRYERRGGTNRLVLDFRVEKGAIAAPS